MAADAQTTVVWRPQPGPQTALITCPVFEVFFGGARGGGKTDGMLGDWIRHAADHGEHAIGLMVRRERTQLIETIERSRQIYAPLGWKYHEQEKMWRAPNGARLRFAYLERDADADAYQGHSYTRVYVEELGTFPSAAPIMKLMATLRSGAGVPCGFRATGNPGGPGHIWVQARYIDPAPTGWDIITERFENPWNGEVVERQRVYIPSRVTDNTYLGTDYVANLQMSGSEQLVRAWLQGDWDIVDGAFFDCWEASKHVIRPFSIPETWLRFRSADWGFAKPFSVGWWAVVDDPHETPDGHTLPRGAIVRYREWYGCEKGKPDTGIRLTAEQVADGIKERERGEKITYGVIDPAAFQHTSGPSIAEKMLVRGVAFRKADNTRVSSRGAISGWDAVRARLIGEDDRPMLYVFSTCTDLIRTLPVMQHDPDRPEDIDTDMEDHCFAAGTLIMLPSGPAPIETLPTTGVVATKDGWQKYRSARLIAQSKDVVRLTFDDGFQVVCTPDHRMMNENGNWINAEDFAWQTSRLTKCKSRSSLLQFKNLMASATIFAGAISKGAELGFTALFGKRISALYQMACISTTKTTTGGITAWGIWSCSAWSNTSAAFMDSTAGNGRGYQFTRRLRPLDIGTARLMGETGIPNTSARISRRFLPNGLLQHAMNAAWNTWRAACSFIAQSIVETTAKRVRCVSVERLQEKQDVYCLTVPGHGNFALANGIIVANCADEARYACLSRPYIPKPKTPEKPKDLIYTARPDGLIAGNMSVRDRVLQLEKRRKQQENTY